MNVNRPTRDNSPSYKQSLTQGNTNRDVTLFKEFFNNEKSGKEIDEAGSERVDRVVKR